MSDVKELDVLHRLGLRATWLHLQLTGLTTSVLTPRDREILTLVATMPFGIPRELLAHRMRASLGTDTNALLRRLAAMEAEGYISQRIHDGALVIDMSTTDLAWLSSQLERLERLECRA